MLNSYIIYNGKWRYFYYAITIINHAASFFNHFCINTDLLNNGGDYTNGIHDTYVEASETKSNGFDKLQGNVFSKNIHRICYHS